MDIFFTLILIFFSNHLYKSLFISFMTTADAKWNPKCLKRPLIKRLCSQPSTTRKASPQTPKEQAAFDIVIGLHYDRLFAEGRLIDLVMHSVPVNFMGNSILQKVDQPKPQK